MPSDVSWAGRVDWCAGAGDCDWRVREWRVHIRSGLFRSSNRSVRSVDSDYNYTRHRQSVSGRPQKATSSTGLP